METFVKCALKITYGNKFAFMFMYYSHDILYFMR